MVPLMTSRFAKIKAFNQKNPLDRFLMSFEKIINWGRDKILDMLKWSLKHKLIVLVSAIILFFSSFLLISDGFIQTEFIDQGDRGEFNLTMELDHTSTLEYTNSFCSKIENKLMSYPDVKLVYTKVGISSAKSATSIGTPYSAEFYIVLVPQHKRKL